MLIYRLAVVLLVVVLTNGVVHAQKLPDLGADPSYLLENRSEVNEQGKKTYQALLRKNNIYISPKDSEYLNYLAGKISLYTKTNSPLFLYLVEERNINAFATPGGYIGINTGLVLATESEHELAGVIAHEIAHVSLSHIERAIAKSQNRELSNLSAVLAGIAVGVATKDFQLGAGITTGVNANEIQNKINDIRSFEIAADDLAKELIEKSGFDINGMQSFFSKLSKKTIASNNTPNYLRTHPIPSERIANLGIPSSKKQLKNSEEYYLFKARVLVGVNDKKIALARIDELMSSKKRLSKDAAIYATALLNQKLGKTHLAVGFRQKMLSSLKSHRDVLLLQAKLYDQTNQYDLAKKLYQSLWKNHNGDGVVAEDYARFLIDQGLFKQAEKMLSQLDSNEDASLILIYGEVLAKQGKHFEKSQWLMRFHEKNGDYRQALFHANEALKNQTKNWQDKIAIQAKKKELEEQIKQAKKLLY